MLGLRTSYQNKYFKARFLGCLKITLELLIGSVEKITVSDLNLIVFSVLLQNQPSGAALNYRRVVAQTMQLLLLLLPMLLKSDFKGSDNVAVVVI